MLAFVIVVGLVVPFALGWAVVDGVRRRGGPVIGVAVALMVLAAVAWPVLAVRSSLTVWDVGLALLALCWGARRGVTADSGGRIVGDLATLLAIVLLSEAGLRGVGAPAPDLPPPGEVTVFLDLANWGDPSCVMAPVRDGDVVHLGDSLVWGEGLEDTETPFVQRIDAASPVHHVNAGVNMTGADCHLAMVQTLRPSVNPGLLVLYVFAGNDLVDMDRPWLTRGGRSVLDYTTDPPTVRPPPEPLMLPFSWRLRDPLPLLFRLSTGFSELARQLTWRMYDVQFNLGFGEQGTMATETQWAHWEQAVTAIHADMQRRGTPMVMVALPHRGALEQQGAGSTPGSETQARVVAFGEQLGVPVWDAEPVLSAAMSRHPYGALFVGEPALGDVHLSALGHGILADWLTPRLDRQLGDKQ